jgi:hypothetical protein
MHFTDRPKVSPFASGKLVNGDIFSLLLKFSCSIIFEDINIIIFLKGGHNGK